MRTSRCESAGLWILGVALCASVAGEAAAQVLPTVPAKKVELVDPEGPVGVDGVEWGKGIAAMGDIDGDGWADFATIAGGGTGGAEGGGDNHVRVVHLRADGTIESFSKFWVGVGGPDSALGGWHYGPRIASLGDLDGDGNTDLAVCSTEGALRVCFLDGDGNLISSHFPGQVMPLTEFLTSFFGASLAAPGDLDGDGIVDLLVGAPGDDTGGTNAGGVWVLLLNTDASVKAALRIAEGVNGFTGDLAPGDCFGSAVSGIGDVNGDGYVDVGVGAVGTPAGGTLRGALWVLFMGPGATVTGQVRITNGEGGFTGTLRDIDHFGASVAGLPDLNGDGRGEVAVGAPGDDGGSSFMIDDYGAVYIFDLGPDGTVQQHSKLSKIDGMGLGTLEVRGYFGTEITAFSIPDGGSCGGLLVSEPDADEWGVDDGAVWAIVMQAGQWNNLGGSLAGQFGVPNLTQAGVQCQGNPLQLMLQTGQGSTLVAMIVGFAQANLPFKGGTLVPFPHLIFTLTTGGGGTLTLTGLWPAGVPSGFTTIFQAWVHDPGAPAGLSASDALMGTAP